MTSYAPEVFANLVLFIRDDDEQAKQWLLDNDCRELIEFWDACEGIEKSFRWLLENNFRPYAATIDAMTGNDQAKVWLISSGYRELAAFVDACTGSQSAIAWLNKSGFKGWVVVAHEVYSKDKKKEKGFWKFLNLGNPFA